MPAWTGAAKAKRENAKIKACPKYVASYWLIAKPGSLGCNRIRRNSPPYKGRFQL